MNTKIVRNLFISSLLVALGACSPAEQGAGEEASAPAEFIALEGSNWQLVQVTVLGGFVFTADEPEKYVLNFRSENRLTGISDCNQISGAWFQEDGGFRFDPFNTSRKLCSPGSLHNNLVLNLKDANAHEFRDGHMFLTTPTEGIVMEFENRDM